MNAIEWTPAKVKRLETLYNGGALVSEIGEAFGVSVGAAKAAINRFCERRSPARSSTNSWNETRDAEAIRLFNEGKSSTEIAMALGGVTRNAVIGRLGRMGYNRGSDANKFKGRARPSAVSLGTAASPTLLRIMAPPVRSGPSRNADSQGGAVHIMNRGEAPERPMGKDHGLAATATLTTLKAHGCKWPIGDPRDSDFGFCGRAREHHAYCEAHRAVAYQAVPEAKAKARGLKRLLRVA
jgi:GcrA cell cycle regulator